MSRDTALTLERLDAELDRAPVEALRQTLRSAGVYTVSPRPFVCEDVSRGATAVVIAGQGVAFVGCARCVFGRFPAAVWAPCRACGSVDDVVLVGANAAVALRAREEGSGRTVWVERVVALAPLCGACRTRRVPSWHGDAPKRSGKPGRRGASHLGRRENSGYGS